MVYESRVGDVFVLGASSWGIEDITHDCVLVPPAPGVPGRMPFWHGDAPGRPVELGRALGAFVRELEAMRPGPRVRRLRASGLDELAARNLVGYLDEQREAAGVLPDDRTIVVERFRDELGDWPGFGPFPFRAPGDPPGAPAAQTPGGDRPPPRGQANYSAARILVGRAQAAGGPPARAARV